MRIAVFFLFLFVLACPPLSSGQDKKKDKKVEPKVMLVLPFGGPPGKTTKMTIRGLKLEQAKEVQVSGGAKAKIVSKGAAPVPDKNPDKVGDTQIVVEVTLPDKAPEKGFEITIVTPDGTTQPHSLLIETRPITLEKEPNPGFKQSQEVKIPAIIEGVIASPRDVDVYRFDGKAGQKIKVSVHANKHGSPLDAMLMLHNQFGALLATADDGKDNRDPVLGFTLPKDGTYTISLIDAHDTGSSIHVYRLLFE